MGHTNPYSSQASIATSLPTSDANGLSDRTFWTTILLTAAISPASFAICEYYDSVLGRFALRLLFWIPVVVGMLLCFVLLAKANTVARRFCVAFVLLLTFGIGLGVLVMDVGVSGLRPTK